MTPEILGRAFDPFFTTKPQGRGRGLGLSVARGLVQASGGTLVLESAPGAGTRAVLELPEVRPASLDPHAADTGAVAT
jgi:signal transduction histidine kinase